MKFARTYQEALANEGYPPEWLESAVPYAQLKKCVKKVQSELLRLGLDPAILAQLHYHSKNGVSADDSDLSIEYEIDGVTKFVPKLTLFIRQGGNFAVDAVLSPETRKHLENIAIERRRVQLDEKNASITPVISASSREPDSLHNGTLDRPGFKRVEIPLAFDAEFFGILYEDVIALTTLQSKQQQSLENDIHSLSTQLVRLAQPEARFRKSDLYRWREIFELYLESEVFFSTHETGHGRRGIADATKLMQWFQGEVMRRGLTEGFKLPESNQALAQFVNINWKLLQNVKFQEINHTAISKIIKKFDKRTRLGATKTFPRLFQSSVMNPATMSKAICAQVSQDLVKIIPQIDDYTCPVCFSIVWRPVRVRCGHLFCIRCTLKLEETRKRCPLCRENVFKNLTIDDLDEDLTKFLKKWFPKEVRERQIVNETESGIEDFGQSYVHPSQRQGCTMM